MKKKRTWRDITDEKDSSDLADAKITFWHSMIQRRLVPFARASLFPVYDEAYYYKTNASVFMLATPFLH